MTRIEKKLSSMTIEEMQKKVSEYYIWYECPKGAITDGEKCNSADGCEKCWNTDTGEEDDK